MSGFPRPSVGVRSAGTLIGREANVDFIPGTNVTLTIVDDPTNNDVNVTIAATGGGGSPAAPAFTFGTANTQGAASTFVPSDSTLAIFDATSPAAVAVTPVVGTVAFGARRDHVHPHEPGHILHDTLWDAAGDLVVGSGPDAAAKLAVGTALMTRLVHTGSGTLAWVPHIVLKTADETVNNSNVLQNDDELLWAVAANEVWFFAMFLRIVAASSGTPDAKFSVIGPAGATSVYAMFPTTNAAGAFSTTDTATQAGSIPMGVFTTERAALLMGVLTNSSTAGNGVLQWAQNTATSENTTLKAGSTLLLWRLT